ncbi:DUF5052 family protein [Halobacillus halophilus]|uniref:DUF5052 family protein n=1 Tax=Halobacillus halophilus TaxID=1570 RepID=UPI001CD3CA7D|nr:DUF5052 family protein [Halobacillus halophilus]MCA1011584.1 DUF5052 family protein [Halobacillus halophilus]
MKKFILLFVFIVPLASLWGCADGDSKENSRTEKIEAFVASTQSGEKGAYKEINSQIIMRGSGETLQVEARKIEDYYTKEGEYIKTILLHSTPKEGDVMKEVSKSLTKMIPEDFAFEQDKVLPVDHELSENEKKKLKEHIVSQFEEKF